MAARSAGVLLYRSSDGRLKVLLAHPGGPYWRQRDAGAWTLVKGEYAADEQPLAAALREFQEETGQALTPAVTIDLGTIRQRGGKEVHGFAVAADFDPAALRSNTFPLEWPPRSGRMVDCPEIDRVAWFDVDQARERINPAQIPFLDRLQAHLATTR